MIRISSSLRLVFLSIFAAFSFACSTPSDATVRREFGDRYAGAKVEHIELIFERDGVATYLVIAEMKGISDDGTFDFSLRRSYGLFWSWCDDQSERKCG